MGVLGKAVSFVMSSLGAAIEGASAAPALSPSPPRELEQKRAELERAAALTAGTLEQKRAALATAQEALDKAEAAYAATEPSDPAEIERARAALDAAHAALEAVDPSFPDLDKLTSPASPASPEVIAAARKTRDAAQAAYAAAMASDSAWCSVTAARDRRDRAALDHGVAVKRDAAARASVVAAVRAEKEARLATLATHLEGEEARAAVRTVARRSAERQEAFTRRREEEARELADLAREASDVLATFAGNAQEARELARDLEVAAPPVANLHPRIFEAMTVAELVDINTRAGRPPRGNTPADKPPSPAEHILETIAPMLGEQPFGGRVGREFMGSREGFTTAEQIEALLAGTFAARRAVVEAQNEAERRAAARAYRSREAIESITYTAKTEGGAKGRRLQREYIKSGDLALEDAPLSDTATDDN